MTDAVVLAGGRGRRLGALTHHRQKGTLRVEGDPIIIHVIRDLLATRSIGTVWVATGYRGTDVHAVLVENMGESLRRGKVVIIDAPNIIGELSRLAYLVHVMPEVRSCLLTGVDTLLPSDLFSLLLGKAEKDGEDSLVFSLSSEIAIAPTHRLAKVANGTVRGYEPREVVCETTDWYVDVGTRFIPARIMGTIKEMSVPPHTDPDDFFRELIVHEKFVRAMVFESPWRHFARARDFSRKSSEK